MAIKDEIKKIQTEKNYLRAAIQEKGVFVNDEPFALYPVRISEITDTPGECDEELRTLIEKKMTSYTVPSYVDTIGSFVFYNCVNLESITIPDSVTYIGHSSFRGCTSLTSIDIPSSVTTIGNQAFRNCTSLTNVNISSGVTEIQTYAFYGCSSLASITVEAVTPPNLGTRAFDNTNDCPIYVPEDSVEAYRTAWPQYADRIQAIPVPAMKWVSSDGTHEISIACEDLDEAGTLTQDDRRIADAGGLMGFVEGSAEIGDCVTTIGGGAFQGCSKLTSIDIPDSVTTIGGSAFYNCTSLTSIDIPDSVTTIGQFAFENCPSLTSVTIPDSVTTIGGGAFGDCTSLTSVTIPDSVTSLGASAFYGCSSLTSVNIPDSVTTIGYSAFQGCSKLTSVTIGNGVTTIESYVFYGLSALTSVTVNATTPPSIGRDVFTNTNNCPIYVPSGSLETYLANSSWAVYKDRLFERGVAKWTEQSFECEVDETDTKTGMVTVVEKDTNPSSPTYNQTRTRTYEDLKRCSSTQSFIKITSLDEVTSGKYLIVNTYVHKALNASLIKDTTTSRDGINANDNVIDVTIENYTIAADANIMNAAADYDADNKTLSWTDSDTGTTYYLYWNGGGAKFAYSGNTQPSMDYPMEAKYYENFGSFSFANSTRLVGYNNENPRFNFYLPNNVYKYESNMALFKLNQ